MAGNYDIVSSYSTEELRGGTQLVPVRVVAFQTKPSAVYAEHRIDLSIIDPVQIGGIIQVYAEAIEALISRPDVPGMDYMQDVNKAGQLVDFMAITIQSTSGNSVETIEYPFELLFQLAEGITPTGYPGIHDVVARLDAIEGL